MRAIHKFPLPVTAIQSVTMQECVKPLSLQLQDGTPTLWCEVDTWHPSVQRQVFCVVTGGQVPTWPCEHIGTVQLRNGLVFHYYLDVRP